MPLITVIALSYAGLLEGSVLTETVFAWPGIGLYITNSLLNADMNAVLGGTIVIGAVFIGINLVSDLLYRVLDPRATLMSAMATGLATWLLDDAPRRACRRGSAAPTCALARASARNPLALARPGHRASPCS